DSVIRDVAPRAVRLRTMARDRDDYLAHPPRGERLRDSDVETATSLYGGHPPRLQLVVSDGLNANAVNEHLRALLPPLRRHLAEAGHTPADVAVVIDNGRVRAGYHAGQLVRAEAVVHLIGERPGTGLNTLSAYITYGRDAA